MKAIFASFAATLLLGTIACGLDSAPRQLAVDESSSFTGGSGNGKRLVNANCPGNGDCTTVECNDDGNGNHTCAPNTTEYTKTRNNFPNSTAAGQDWETTKPKQYVCGTLRACSNPCSQSTVTNKWYCGGAVGPVVGAVNGNGIEGDDPYDPEA